MGTGEYWIDFFKTILKYYIGFFALPFWVWGLSKIKNHRGPLLFAFFTAMAFIMFVSADAFAHHQYYFFPIIILFALPLIFALNSLPNNKWRGALLILLLVSNVLGKPHLIFQKRYYYDELHENARSLVEAQTESRDLILVQDRGHTPYHLHAIKRRGWVEKVHKLHNPNFIRDIKNQGCKWVVYLDNNSFKLIGIDSWLQKISQ